MSTDIFTAEQARELKERRVYELIKKSAIEGCNSCRVRGISHELKEELVKCGYKLMRINSQNGKDLYKIEW